MWAGFKETNKQYGGLATVKSNFQNQKKVVILRGPADGTVVFSRKTQPTAKSCSEGTLGTNNMTSLSSFPPNHRYLTTQNPTESQNQESPLVQSIEVSFPLYTAK